MEFAKVLLNLACVLLLISIAWILFMIGLKIVFTIFSMAHDKSRKNIETVKLLNGHMKNINGFISVAGFTDNEETLKEMIRQTHNLIIARLSLIEVQDKMLKPVKDVLDNFQWPDEH